MTAPVNVHSWASALAWLSDRIVAAVHNQDPTEIARCVQMARSLTSPAGVDTADAVIVTLAAMASPDRDAAAVLRWVAEYGDEVDRVHEQIGRAS